MLVLVRIKSVHVVQQRWVAVKEMRLGDEHRRPCRTRGKRFEQRAGPYDGVYHLNAMKCLLIEAVFFLCRKTCFLLIFDATDMQYDNLFANFLL